KGVIMKSILILLLLCNLVFSAEFKDALELTESYKKFGFIINDQIKIEMFKSLSNIYDNVKLFFEKELIKEETQHTVISFVDPLLHSKVLIANGFIHLNIPEQNETTFDFNRFIRAKKIFNFLE